MTDLTDRMRTCAAHLLSGGGRTVEDLPLPLRDCADLLIEASNALEAVPQPLGEPMEVIEAIPPAVKAVQEMWTQPPVVRANAQGTWIDPGGALPQPRGKFNPRACPQCDSRANKRVYREGKLLMLACPVCGAGWEWKR